MIKAIKHIWKKLEAIAAENRRREAEKQQMLRENLEAWNEMNRGFIKKMNREVDKEIKDRYDFTKVPKPNAINFDGSPLN